MALNKPQLVANLVEILSDPETTNNATEIAQKLADAIEVYVKSGTVTGICGGQGSPLAQGKVT